MHGLILSLVRSGFDAEVPEKCLLPRRQLRHPGVKRLEPFHEYIRVEDDLGPRLPRSPPWCGSALLDMSARLGGHGRHPSGWKAQDVSQTGGEGQGLDLQNSSMGLPNGAAACTVDPDAIVVFPD